MELTYYPGCTLKNQARALETSALAALDLLGINAVELPRWNCCGVFQSLADDSLMGLLAPTRILIRAQETGRSRLVTLCSMCYNTLAQTNLYLQNNPEKLGTLNSFMYEEPDYQGGVRVEHCLSVLAADVGWEKISKLVKKPLTGRRTALYYGCKLQRPKTVGIEPVGEFQFMGKLVEALGGEVVDFQAEDRCCGSYQTLAHEPAAVRVSTAVVSAAKKAGADFLALSCPLCQYNLERAEKMNSGSDLPIIYFSQLLAEALGVAVSS